MQNLFQRWIFLKKSILFNVIIIIFLNSYLTYLFENYFVLKVLKKLIMPLVIFGDSCSSLSSQIFSKKITDAIKQKICSNYV